MRFFLGFTFVALTVIGNVFAQDSAVGAGPQYLQNSGSTQFARPISTPSMSLSGPALTVGASNATEGLIAGAETRNVEVTPAVSLPPIDLFPVFYGDPRVVAIESEVPAANATAPPEPPSYSSLHDTGVGETTTPHSLRAQGYGVTLAQGSALGKAEASHGSRLYTNADIDRMHSAN